VVFENDEFARTVSIDEKNNAYYVSVVDGVIDEKLLTTTEIIK
jgi:hypothetical protein